MNHHCADRRSKTRRRLPRARFTPSQANGADDRLLPEAIARAKRGHNDALHFLYARYADDVLGYVRSIVRDHHEAEDITHNVFGKLARALQNYEPREVPFAAWILRVSRNAALDHLRTRRAIPSEDVLATDEGYRQPDSDRSQSLKEAFACLPDEQRDVLLLRHVAGLSPGEIAAALDKTESSVHGLHHRGRGRLQTALRELGAAPITAMAS